MCSRKSAFTQFNCWKCNSWLSIKDAGADGSFVLRNSNFKGTLKSNTHMIRDSVIKVSDRDGWIRRMMDTLNRICKLDSLLMLGIRSTFLIRVCISLSTIKLFSKSDPASGISPLLGCSCFPTSSSSCFSFSCNFNLFRPPGILSGNAPRLLLSHFHSDYTANQRKGVFSHFLLVVVHFILELADQPVVRMSSICWIELMKYGSLMEKKKKPRAACPITRYFIF